MSFLKKINKFFKEIKNKLLFFLTSETFFNRLIVVLYLLTVYGFAVFLSYYINFPFGRTQNLQDSEFFNFVVPMRIFFGIIFFLEVFLIFQQDFSSKLQTRNKQFDVFYDRFVTVLKLLRWVISICIVGISGLLVLLRMTSYASYKLTTLLMMEYFLSLLKSFSYYLLVFFLIMLALNFLFSQLEGKEFKYSQLLYDLLVVILFMWFTAAILPSLYNLNTLLSYYGLVNYGVKWERPRNPNLEKLKVLFMKAVETGAPKIPSPKLELAPNQLGTIIVNGQTGQIAACLDMKKSLELATQNTRDESACRGIRSWVARQGGLQVKENLGLPDIFCVPVVKVDPETAKSIIDSKKAK